MTSDAAWLDDIAPNLDKHARKSILGELAYWQQVANARAQYIEGAAASHAKMEAELAEARRDAEQFSCLLYRAVDVLHESRLRDEIFAALEGKP
jgi:hypothetical protein